MIYTIVYDERVVRKDIPRLNSNREIIKKAIETKLGREPQFYSYPLGGDLKVYRKFRVGAYRVIFRLEADKIKILKIGHRSNVYKEFVRCLFGH